MLEIINNLKYFFEDCYKRIGVREYSRLSGKSPPTSSKLLKNYAGIGLLNSETSLGHLFFSANKQSKEFVSLSRIYWDSRLKELIQEIEYKTINPLIILFGSLSKAESKENSDVDIAIFSEKKEINLKEFEKKIKRNIQVFWFDSLHNLKNKELKNSILNGHKLNGEIKL